METYKESIQQIVRELNDLAYNTYHPLVDQCLRNASKEEVEHLLDYMVGVCNDDRMTELFKQVCRRYYKLYPDMIVSEINTYREIYEDQNDE